MGDVIMSQPATGRAKVNATEIEDALDALLTALIAYRERRDEERTEPVEFRIVSAAEFAKGPVLTREQIAIAAIVKDPVEGAMLRSIRWLGELLHSLGGTDLMREACDRACDRDPSHWSRRASIIDHRWDGIGTKSDFWAC